MKVFVYFNLHKKLYSIKALDGPCKGRVVAHATHVALDNCTFAVSEAGRQRVIREQKKNVHAGVMGILVSFKGQYRKGCEFELTAAECRGWYWTTSCERLAECAKKYGVPIKYNPYKYETFVSPRETPVHNAGCVNMVPGAVYASTIDWNRDWKTP